MAGKDDGVHVRSLFLPFYNLESIKNGYLTEGPLWLGTGRERSVFAASGEERWMCMRKKSTRLMALALAAVLALSGCSGSGGDKGGTTSGGESAASEQIKDFITYELTNRELSGFNILNTELAQDLDVLTNLTDSLLEVDAEGKLAPAMAEEWGTEDGGKTWTFHIREGVKWVDVNGNEKADVTAQDWITGLEWVVNYHKNGASNTSMPFALIEGAQDYYEYTKGLSKEEALSLDKSKFLEMVGIEAPDDYTLVYTCTKPAPYFDTVATSACLYPVCQSLIDEVGVENFIGISNETMWYNGCYTMTSYIQGNEKVMTKNPAYWDKDASLFDTVTIKMVESDDVAYQLYQTGELDWVRLTESTLKTISDSESNEYHDQLVEMRPTKYSYQIHFNYDKRNSDTTPDENWNKAVANEAFRLAWYYGLDLTTYMGRYNSLDPLSCENNAYTMKGALYYSDGTDYIDVVQDKIGIKTNGETPARLDADKAAQYKAQAMEELSAQGVTFPVQVDFYAPSGDQTKLDNATVLKQAFSSSLGDDFVVLNIKTFVNSQTTEVVEPRLQSFVLNGWGADFGDPQNFVGQEIYGDDGAYYSRMYSNINDATDEKLLADYQEFTDMVRAADAITDDLDARYDKYAEAEAFMIQHAFSIPAHYDIRWELTHVNDYTKMNAMFGCQNFKYKNWETSVDAYTTEQYEEFASSFGGTSAAFTATEAENAAESESAAE